MSFLDYTHFKILIRGRVERPAITARPAETREMRADVVNILTLSRAVTELLVANTHFLRSSFSIVPGPQSVYRPDAARCVSPIAPAAKWLGRLRDCGPAAPWKS